MFKPKNMPVFLKTFLILTTREYKLIGVQDWLTERDILLSSHLEHELTVDDLPDECQVFISSLS